MRSVGADGKDGELSKDTVYIGGLAFTTDKETLRSALEKEFGRVSNIVVRDAVNCFLARSPYLRLRLP